VRHDIQGVVLDWDVCGTGDSLAAALRAYAADCRKDASAQQTLVEALLDEAHRAEKAASAIEEIETT
jgi:hypothetical protein